jgi:hypothetical protein
MRQLVDPMHMALCSSCCAATLRHCSCTHTFPAFLPPAAAASCPPPPPNFLLSTSLPARPCPPHTHLQVYILVAAGCPHCLHCSCPALRIAAQQQQRGAPCCQGVGGGQAQAAVGACHGAHLPRQAAGQGAAGVARHEGGGVREQSVPTRLCRVAAGRTWQLLAIPGCHQQLVQQGTVLGSCLHAWGQPRAWQGPQPQHAAAHLLSNLAAARRYPAFVKCELP